MLLALLALAGAHPAHSSSCAATAVYRGVSYFGTTTPTRFRTGRPLRRVTAPPCNDTVVNGVPADEPPTSVHARRIVGVDPAYGFTDDSRHVYVATGYFPALPDFPLHRILPNWMDFTGRCTQRAVLMRGRAASPPSGELLRLRLSSGRVLDVFVTPTSRLGFPVTRRIRAGTRLTVLARTCGRTRVAVRVS